MTEMLALNTSLLPKIPFKPMVRRIHPAVRYAAKAVGTVTITLALCAAVFCIPVAMGVSPYYCDKFVNTPGISGKIAVLRDGLLDKSGGGKATVTIDGVTSVYYYGKDGNLLSVENQTAESDAVCGLFGCL